MDNARIFESSKASLPAFYQNSRLRSGKWTSEEEKYADQIIENYENGTLNISGDSKLLTVLASSLHCDPRRITEKYKNHKILNKQHFIPVEPTPETATFIDKFRTKLHELKSSWITKLNSFEKPTEESKPCRVDSLYVPQAPTLDSPKLEETQALAEEEEMKKRLGFILTDPSDIDSTVLSIRSFRHLLKIPPTNADVMQAVAQQRLKVQTLHSIVTSGCCLVEDPLLQQLHRIAASFMFSLHSMIQPSDIEGLLGRNFSLGGPYKHMNGFPKSNNRSSSESDDSSSLKPASSTTEPHMSDELSSALASGNSNAANSADENSNSNGDLRGKGINPNTGDDSNSNSIEESGDTNSQSDENSNGNGDSTTGWLQGPNLVSLETQADPEMKGKNPLKRSTHTESFDDTSTLKDSKRAGKRCRREEGQARFEHPHAMEAVSSESGSTTSDSLRNRTSRIGLVMSGHKKEMELNRAEHHHHHHQHQRQQLKIHQLHQSYQRHVQDELGEEGLKASRCGKSVGFSVDGYERCNGVVGSDVGVTSSGCESSLMEGEGVLKGKLGLVGFNQDSTEDESLID